MNETPKGDMYKIPLFYRAIEGDNEIIQNMQISQHQADKLKKQALEVQSLFAKMAQTFSTEQAEQYYILSKNWLDKWKKYVSYNELIEKQPPTNFFGRIQIPTLNTDIIDNNPDSCFKYTPLREHPWNVWMKDNLQEGVDYIIVNKEIWNFFAQHHHGYAIPRTVNMDGDNKTVIVNLLKFQSVLLYPSIISQISNDMLYKNTFEKEFLQVDRNMDLKEFIALIQRTVPTFRGDYARDNGVRLWKYSSTQSDVQKALFTDIKKQVQDYDMHDEQSFDFNGEYLDPLRFATIEDIGIQATDLIIVEFKAANKPWCVRNAAVIVEGKCEGCMAVKVLNFPCVCRKVSYCSEDCMKNDEKFHSSRCEKYGSDDEAIKAIKLSASSMKGIVGLSNLGNTCFMNSGIQCVANTFPLTEFFLSNRYFDEINEDNPLGTKGKLVRKFGSLLRKMWFGDKSVVTPVNFKKAVGQFQPMFKGYHQHDSSELITFLLDGIHEDLNRVKTKPYVESKDSAGRIDFDVAKESWSNHLARNQSIVVDLMYGQYKSKLRCPNCDLVSITFDPFLMVQVGIPSTKKKSIQLKIYQSLFSYQSQSFPYDKSKATQIGEFRKQIAAEQSLDSNNLILYIPSSYSSYEPITDNKALADIRKTAKKSYLCMRVLSDLEKNIPVDQRIYLSYQNKAQEGFGYKRTLYQNGIMCFGSNFTLKQVHLVIFKLLIGIFSEIKMEVDINKEDALLEYYEQNILKKYYSLEYKSNSSFWQNCSFCNKKQCQDCNVEFSDETVEEVKGRVLKSDQQCSVEFSILWTASPIKNVKVFDIFDHFLKNQSQIEEENNKPKSTIISTNNQSSNSQQVTLYDCLQYSAQPEQLAADNAWYCRNCKDHVQAYKSMHIYKAPKILIFTLKRFKAQNRIFKSKLETYVDFPINGLDMSEYIINKNTPFEYESETMENNGETNKEKKVFYDLFAISNHFGGLGGGHYTAFAKNQYTKKWYNMDDSHCSQVSEDSIITKAAYVLFYQLRQDSQGQDIMQTESAQEQETQVLETE